MNINIKPEEFTPEFYNSVKNLIEAGTEIVIRIHPEKETNAAGIEQLKKKEIKLLVLDIDGVLTDTGIYISDNNEELKKFNAKDGYGMIQFIKNNGQIAFLSSGKNTKIIEKRAEMIGVQHIITGTWDKITKLGNLSEKLNINFENIAYIGDDMNDFEAMQNVGFTACPADAHPEIKKMATLTLQNKGGEGCVREFLDLL